MLVTRGVYRLCRHPGYLGWYAWAVGTQLLLCNPICTPAFAYAVRTPTECEPRCVTAAACTAVACISGHRPLK